MKKIYKESEQEWLLLFLFSSAKESGAFWSSRKKFINFIFKFFSSHERREMFDLKYQRWTPQQRGMRRNIFEHKNIRLPPATHLGRTQRPRVSAPRASGEKKMSGDGPVFKHLYSCKVVPSGILGHTTYAGNAIIKSQPVHKWEGSMRKGGPALRWIAHTFQYTI